MQIRLRGMMIMGMVLLLFFLGVLAAPIFTDSAIGWAPREESLSMAEAGERVRILVKGSLLKKAFDQGRLSLDQSPMDAESISL